MAKSSFIKEFKDFAVKGNAVDMAVGVIIGGAFGKIVSSIVNDLIMPPIGWLIGGIDFKDLKYDLPVNPLNEGGEPVSIAYGNFIQTCLDFFIIAFCVFLLVRALMKLSRKKEEAPAPQAPAEPSEEVKLLTEIRDALKNK
ncbi:large-conductance mechanosensitive channel protein MscL [bacterium]|nr:large-conductance mechanosensitive channel protein MscL [bacterium]